MIDRNFVYYPPREGQPRRYEQLRNDIKDLAETICILCPDSDERSIALTKLEEVIMWSNASIAREGITAGDHKSFS